VATYEKTIKSAQPQRDDRHYRANRGRCSMTNILISASDGYACIWRPTGSRSYHWISESSMIRLMNLVKANGYLIRKHYNEFTFMLEAR
jgi:hypothetical protein